MKPLAAGASATREFETRPEHSAEATGNAGVDVISSTALIAFAEIACGAVFADLLDPGEASVGVRFDLSVAENIFLGDEKSQLGFIDRRAMEAAALPLLRRLSAPFSPSARVSQLSLAERQLVEIARALAEHPRILVMDEPTKTKGARADACGTRAVVASND